MSIAPKMNLFVIPSSLRSLKWCNICVNVRGRASGKSYFWRRQRLVWKWITRFPTPTTFLRALIAWVLPAAEASAWLVEGVMLSLKCEPFRVSYLILVTSVIPQVRSEELREIQYVKVREATVLWEGECMWPVKCISPSGMEPTRRFLPLPNLPMLIHSFKSPPPPPPPHLSTSVWHQPPPPPPQPWF